MSTPIVVGGIYAHPHPLFGRLAPVLFRVINANDQRVLVRPVLGRRRLLMEVSTAHFTAGCFELVDQGHTDETGDDLMTLAEAVGVVAEEVRPPGAQPAVEFTDGPDTNGPVWSDANLAEVFFEGGDTA